MNTYIPGSPAFWIAVMVSIPLLTMRLFAEERRQGTIEALLTVPVTETEVVVAKWLAGVIMYCAVAGAILHVSAVPAFPGQVRFRPGADHEPVGRSDDDGHDVRIDRFVPELADAEPDHRGDLDVRRACWF